MSDNGATAFPTQLAVTCGFCGDTNDIQWFCKSCAESLCNSCKASHITISLFKNHIVVPRTNDVMRLYGPSKIAEQCHIHPEKEVSIYCKNCQVPCCVTCQVQNHQKHDISTIEDAYLSVEDSLNDKVRKLEKEVIPTLEHMEDQTKKDRSEKKAHVDRVKGEVNTFRKEMKQAVDESCDDLLETLEHNVNDSEFDNVFKSIDTQKGKIHDMIKEINGIIQKGDLSMMKYSPPSLKALLPEVRSPNLIIPVFKPGRDILSIIREKIGKIEWADRTSEQNHTLAPMTKWNLSIININKVTSFTCKIGVTSITTAGNNTAWVMSSGSETMHLYDGSSKMVRSFTLIDSEGINDMEIRRSGEMIITCGDMKVRRISQIGVVSILKDTSPYVPYGVCLTDREDVVVCLRGHRKKNHTAVYSPDTGRKLREIKGIDGQGIQQIMNPYSVVSNGKGLCMVNGNPSNVVCVDERGDVRWVYDGKEAKMTKTLDFCGISVDKYNNLLVTDYNNDCVHYIDREGRLIHIILTQEQTGFSGPWGICVDDKTGLVWVGNLSVSDMSKVVISKYLP